MISIPDRILALERAEAKLKDALACITLAWGGPSEEEIDARSALKTENGISPIAYMADGSSLIERGAQKIAKAIEQLRRKL